MQQLDRNSLVVYLMLNHLPNGDLSVHRVVENLRRLRLGGPIGMSSKLKLVEVETCPKTIQCLNNAGRDLLNKISELGYIDQDILFWLQRRVHLLPYFDVGFNSDPKWSKSVVDEATNHHWFFYLMYSDPLI